jgi:uncharacterized protein YbjT (DUF2867 family)
VSQSNFTFDASLTLKANQMEDLNIVVGGTGQVGSTIVRELAGNGASVRAVIRNSGKFAYSGIEAKIADLFNADQLIEAFQGGTTVFLLTPEDPASVDILGETKLVVENYKKAVKATGVKKIVGLSCVGAHMEGNTGNILMSRILEKGFDDVDVERVFIRPSYYFSNWLPSIETIEQDGILPTFFPVDFTLEMHSPIDVARFTAKIMVDKSSSKDKNIFELVGPRKYSSLDVAKIYSRLLNKEVTAQPIPQDKWKETLMSVGFTENTAINFSSMTQAVIDKKTVPEWPNDVIKLPTTLEEYIEEQLKRNKM